jgi:hypothetical protein
VPRVNFYCQTISSLLWRCEYDNDKNGNFNFSRKVVNNSPEHVGKTYGGINFDPTVTDAAGQVQHYQRGLVWTLEQNQQLINSIYLQVEIGKFVFRKRSWGDIERGMRGPSGHGYSYDCCDGKQRLHAILGFVTNQFPDNHGNYYRDLSNMAQRRFLNFDRLSYGELEEGTTDKQVLATFLNLNYAGTPIAESHTQFVQSIKM